MRLAMVNLNDTYGADNAQVVVNDARDAGYNVDAEGRISVAAFPLRLNGYQIVLTRDGEPTIETAPENTEYEASFEARNDGVYVRLVTYEYWLGSDWFGPFKTESAAMDYLHFKRGYCNECRRINNHHPDCLMVAPDNDYCDKCGLWEACNTCGACIVCEPSCNC